MRKSKADLQAEIEALKQQLREAERTLVGLGGLHAHVANHSAGIPVCIASNDDENELAVNLYRDFDGVMRGVGVTDGPDTLGWFGWVPGEVVMEELSYQ